MTAEHFSKIVFLFGAGISIPAEMPTTCDITESVLACKNVKRASDGIYYPNTPDVRTEQYLERVRVFIELLTEEVSRFYSERQTDRHPPFNYEDLYYVARQIRDYEEPAQDNPAILPLIEKIKPRIGPLLNVSNGDVEIWTSWGISNETLHHIEDVVRGLLRKEPADLNYLGFIQAAWDSCDAVDIFTLNHDTVLEQYLNNKGIPFADGFGEEQGGVRRWDRDLYESGGRRIRLFKLHGGVNWYPYRPAGGTVLDNILCINDGNPRNVEGLELVIREDPAPSILIGTYNKMVDYANEVFLDLRHMFYKSLHSARNVVVSGYSFGDHGINKVLDIMADS